MKEEKGCSRVDTVKGSIERQSKEQSHWEEGTQVILGFHINSSLCAETGTSEGLHSLCLSFLAQIPLSLSV